jgi:hypothetical protein
MHKQRLAVVIAAGLGVISTFLPWGSYSANLGIFGGFQTYSYSGITTLVGILAFLLCGGAIALAFIGDREKAIDADKVKFVAIAGAAVFLFSLLHLLLNMGGSSELDITGLSKSSISFGVFITIIAGLATVAVPFVVKDSGEISMPTKDSIKDEFNNMKEDK